MVYKILLIIFSILYLFILMGAGCSIDCSENIHDFESQSNELKSIDIKDMDK